MQYVCIRVDMLFVVTLSNCDFIFYLPGVGGANMLLAQLALVAVKASLSSLKIANGVNFERLNQCECLAASSCYKRHSFRHCTQISNDEALVFRVSLVFSYLLIIIFLLPSHVTAYWCLDNTHCLVLFQRDILFVWTVEF